MNVEYFWPTPVWYDYLNLDYDTMINKCFEMEKESEGRKFSNYGGWQSHDIQLDAIPEFKELHRQIKQKIDEVCLDLGEHFKLDFDNAWININRGSDYKDRKSTRLNSSHIPLSRMPSSA